MPHPTYLLRQLPALIIATALSLSAWYWLGHPVPIAEPPVTAPIACLSYTHYRDGESPFDKQSEEGLVVANIEADLKLLSGITSCIRLYAAQDMQPVLRVAEQFGLQVLLGAWVSREEKATRQEIETLVTLANRFPRTVRGVLVGNETLLRGEIEPDRLARLLLEVRQRVRQPVSYADVWEFLLHNPEVAEACDFVTVHILPYWEDKPVAIDEALDQTAKVRQRIVERFPGKPVLIGETGWPSSGRMREGARPSRVNAARYLRGFIATARAEGWDYNLIEAFDQPWKRSQEGTVGGYWGLFDTARHDKQLLNTAVSNHPHWPGYTSLAVVLACLITPLLRMTLMTSPLVALVTVGWTLQLEQLAAIIDYPGQTAWACILLGVTLTASLAGLARHVERPFAPPREAYIVLALGCIASVLCLWLAFDPRYRDFFVAGFLPPALLLALPTRVPEPVLRQGLEETAIGALLALSAVFIAVNETWLNLQAIAWSLAMLMLGCALLRRGLRGS